MGLQDRKISFIRKWNVISSLAMYAAGDEGAFDFVDLNIVARNELKTEDGKKELHRWLESFHRARASASEFEATCRSVPYSDIDWTIMDDCATRMLNALERSLVKRARKREASGLMI